MVPIQTVNVGFDSKAITNRFTVNQETIAIIELVKNWVDVKKKREKCLGSKGSLF